MEKSLGYSMVDYLGTLIREKHVKEEGMESLEVAIQCIKDALNLEEEEVEHYTPRTKEGNRMDLKKAYLQWIHQETRETSPAQKEQEGVQGEKYKTEGNQKMQDGLYKEAVEAYTKAIDCVPTKAIYYANRAAAYSHLNEYEQAVKDCQKALQLDPQYSKGYSRMGLAYFQLEKYEDAVNAYKEALRLDPTSESIKSSLKTAESKLKEEKGATNTNAHTSNTNSNGMDFASILNNPMMKNLASQFMNNPSLAQMASQFGSNSGSGEGSMPDIGQLMNNPNLMNLAQSFLQSNPDLLNNLSNGLGRSSNDRNGQKEENS